MLIIYHSVHGCGSVQDSVVKSRRTRPWNYVLIDTDLTALQAMTYIEPIDWTVVEKIIIKERPSALLPTMGGQTALNCALDLVREGV